ncbi:hypothetical protein OG599_25950 [Streptomyces sp. NBC_01335]|uniref:hypothetical protein n=1 Tax=Streptomyces sp. NBC_01335 TaxID=2903828 RepID=UPI002E0F2FCA|nr:hypothetical protein OG599_25950 [Streptomyces sp. NBC_01335]
MLPALEVCWGRPVRPVLSVLSVRSVRHSKAKQRDIGGLMNSSLPRVREVNPYVPERDTDRCGD